MTPWGTAWCRVSPALGGNVTGISTISTELYKKRAELLKEGIPGLERIALIMSVENPVRIPILKFVEAAGQSLGYTTELVSVRTVDDFGPAFDTAKQQRADAAILILEPLTLKNASRIVQAALGRRLPTIYAARGVDDGPLAPLVFDVTNRRARHHRPVFMFPLPCDSIVPA